MCEPVTLALAAASVVVGVTSAVMQGNSQANQAEAQAQMQRDAGALEQQRASQTAGRIRTQASLAIGSARAAIGASGVTQDSPSIVDSIGDFRSGAEQDVSQVKSNAALSAWGYNTQADILESSARNSRFQGYLGAGATFLNAAAGAYAKLPSGKLPGPGRVGLPVSSLPSTFD